MTRVIYPVLIGATMAALSALLPYPEVPQWFVAGWCSFAGALTYAIIWGRP